MIVTYFFGFVFVFFSYNIDNKQLSSFEMTELFYSIIVPTTVPYVLVNVIENILEMFESNAKRIIWNLFNVFAITGYTVLYPLYLTNTRSIPFIIMLFLATIVLWVLNWLCYTELYNQTNKNHDFI